MGENREARPRSVPKQRAPSVMPVSAGHGRPPSPLAEEISRQLEATPDVRQALERLSNPIRARSDRIATVSARARESTPRGERAAVPSQPATLDPPNRSADTPPYEPIGSTAGLGALVRDARRSRGLTQQQFADLAGVGRRFLSEFEQGKPTIELGKALGVLAAAGIDLFARKR